MDKAVLAFLHELSCFVFLLLSSLCTMIWHLHFAYASAAIEQSYLCRRLQGSQATVIYNGTKVLALNSSYVMI